MGSEVRQFDSCAFYGSTGSRVRRGSRVRGFDRLEVRKVRQARECEPCAAVQPVEGRCDGRGFIGATRSIEPANRLNLSNQHLSNPFEPVER